MDGSAKRQRTTEEAKEARHHAIAARVESSSCENERFVPMSEREEDTDMELGTLEALYIGQARSTWKGVPFGKSACDWQIYATLIEELQPCTIIDIGSWAGGSALFFADFAQMLVGSHFHKVISLDITLKNVRAVAREHPHVEFHECSTENFNTLFTHEFSSNLPHPWLIVEDAHYHFDKVMPVLHSLMKPGDYLICEDTSAQMQDWFEANNQDADPDERDHTREAIEQLRHTAQVLREHCKRHSGKYRCDTKYLDMFGYNVGKHWNSIVKRVA